MEGKISKIKNTEDELLLPVTTAEAVYMEDGETKLNDEIKNINSSLDNITSQLSKDLATKDYVEDAINSAKFEGGDVPVDLSVYARKTDLDEYVTDSELNSKGYLTEHQDISGKVDKVNGYSLVSNAEINRLATLKNYDDGEIRELISTIAPPNIIYMDSYGELTDYSAKLQELVNSGNNVEIRFSNKEYVFKSKVTISKKIRLIGSNSSFVWKGEGRFLEYVNAPWMIEGCVIKDIIFTGRGLGNAHTILG